MPALRPIPSDGAKGVYLVPMSEYDRLAREHGEMVAALTAVLKAHGYVSDENTDHWDCECMACSGARALLARIEGGKS